MNFLEKLFKRADEIENKDNNEEESRVVLPPRSKPQLEPRFVFEIEDIKKSHDIIFRGVDNGEDLVRAILGDYSFKVEMVSRNKKEKFEIISKNFKSKITHPGFIYYLAYCWGEEIGIVLRPDIIWSCILYEFSKHIIDTKEKYFNDFKELYRDKNNSYDGHMTSYDLVDKFRSYIKYEEFYRLIVQEKFDNEPNNFIETKILTFCNFARVEYKKFKMNCNIPKFQIKGNKEDWIKLLGLIDVLIHLIDNRGFINYLENIKSLMSNITMNTFQIMLSEPRLRYQGIREMIKDIFYIDKDENVKGWGSELYFDCYMNKSREWKLDDFNTHISYIPYINLKTREACIKAGGLCYSSFDKDCLEPFYGSILCRMIDVNTYKKL